jgi:EAL domain-containing protein (putative c-di-GMP-specific phosphodiesterase class I)
VKDLIETNCLIGQGYWFSRPMPKEDVNTWLTGWHITHNNIA